MHDAIHHGAGNSEEDGINDPRTFSQNPNQKPNKKRGARRVQIEARVNELNRKPGTRQESVMIRSAIIASALVLASTAHAETLKRDINGIEPGMKFEQAEAIAQGQNQTVRCERENGFRDFDFNFRGWLDCHYLNNASAPTFQVGPYSHKVLAISAITSGTKTAEQALPDICRQFTTECSHVAVNTPIALGNGVVLTVSQGDGGYVVSLRHNDLISHEPSLRPPPARSHGSMTD